MTKTFLKSWRSLASAAVLLAAANACGGDGTITNTNPTVAGLRFSVQPSSGAAGAPFSVSVELLNSAGTKIATATNPVTLTVNGGADLRGTLTQNAVAGVATFSGLSVTRAGTGFTVTAAANGVTASSSSFTITPAAANAGQSSATFTPSTVTTGATIAVVFTFKDQFGNPLPNKTVSLASSLGGVTFTPSSGTTSATGTFTTNMVATTAGSATVSATVDGVVVSLPTAVTITAPPQFTITLSANPTNGGTTSGGGLVNSGASVTVVATPATGFTFTNWTESGTAVSTSASFTFTATVNRTLVANFTATPPPTCTVTTTAFPVNVSGSLSTATCTSSSQAAAFYRFTTQASGPHTFGVTTSFNGPSLAVTSDPPGSNVVFTNSAGTTTGTDWLIPAGTYQVRVAALTATSGTFTLTGALGSTNNTSCTTRAFLVSITVTQTLASTDCAYPTADGTVEDRYAIFSNRACQITMTGSASMLPWIEIRDASTGAILQFAGAATGQTTATLSRTACISNSGGVVLLIANSTNTVAQGGVGSYTYTLTLSGTATLRDGNIPNVYESPWLDVALDAAAGGARTGFPVKPTRK